MPRQELGVGSAPNDGTGDPLRDALIKANSNFTELYAQDSELQAAIDELATEVEASTALAPDGTKQFEAGLGLGAVNFLRLQGALANDAVSISSQGTDADIPISYAAKGTESHHFGNGGGQQFEIRDAGSPTSSWPYVHGGTSSSDPPAMGSPNNLNFEVGSGFTVRVVINGAITTEFARFNPANAVNAYPILSGSDGAARFTTGGAGTNRGFFFQTAGTGSYIFWNGSGALCTFDQVNAGTPVNQVLIRANTAGTDATIRSAGEANGSLQISPTVSGTGTVKISRFNAVNVSCVTGVTYNTPTTGFSITIGDTSELHLTPAGTLAAGTLTMPSAPVDGQTVTISTTQTITALTHNPNSGQTLLGALTTLAANGFATYRYRASTTTWRRVG
jgi:hypothetical protein